MLRLTDAESNEFVYKLEAGKSFILWTHKTAMSAKDTTDTGAPDADIVSMEAQANSAACDLEILIASVS